MSLNSLLESANPYQSLQSDAARLASKWEKTGLLEGLQGASKNNMGMILENQAKQLVVESSQTGGGAASTGTFSSQTQVNEEKEDAADKVKDGMTNAISEFADRVSTYNIQTD